MSARQRGFTLVEVLVALVVMATMALLAWRGLDALLKSRDIAQANLDQSSRLQTVLAQWEQDLRELQDSGVATALSFDGASLRITRQQPQGMQVVAWSLRAGRLYRWEGPIVQTVQALQDSYQRSQQLPGQGEPELLALEGVDGWQIFFYRGNAWSNAQSSDDLVSQAAAEAAAAPASGASAATVAVGPTRRALPSGVRMLLQFGAGSGFNGSLTRQIVLGPQPS